MHTTTYSVVTYRLWCRSSSVSIHTSGVERRVGVGVSMCGVRVRVCVVVGLGAASSCTHRARTSSPGFLFLPPPSAHLSISCLPYFVQYIHPYRLSLSRSCPFCSLTPSFLAPLPLPSPPLRRQPRRIARLHPCVRDNAQKTSATVSIHSLLVARFPPSLSLSLPLSFLH